MESLKDFLNESTINEARKTVTTFAYYLQANGGMVPMDNGEYYYFCKILNDNNFDFTKVPKLKEQLKSEGKFDREYASGVTSTNPEEKINAANLPIYGDTQKYVTYWFNGDMEACIKADLKDRGMNLKKRIDYFVNNDIPATV